MEQFIEEEGKLYRKEAVSIDEIGELITELESKIEYLKGFLPEEEVEESEDDEESEDTTNQTATVNY